LQRKFFVSWVSRAGSALGSPAYHERVPRNGGEGQWFCRSFPRRR